MYTNDRIKVARLCAYVNKKEFKEMPININTRVKAYGLSAAGFAVLTGLSLAVLLLLNLHGNAALWYLAVAPTLSYFTLAVLLDKFHIEIEHVTKPFKKK
ncbi:MAG TPA: hypothetical protein VMT96_00105 [Candidatus Bathyarchaeia archaeon]|nr:hypothetical protein [Candidatus Bathyarchaeia archaeon]